MSVVAALLAGCVSAAPDASTPKPTAIERVVANGTVRQVMYVAAAAPPMVSASSSSAALSAAPAAAAASGTGRSSASTRKVAKAPVPTARQRREAAARAAAAEKAAANEQADRQRVLSTLSTAPGYSYVYTIELDAGSTQVLRFAQEQAPHVNDRVMVQDGQMTVVR